MRFRFDAERLSEAVDEEVSDPERHLLAEVSLEVQVEHSDRHQTRQRHQHHRHGEIYTWGLIILYSETSITRNRGDHFNKSGITRIAN